MILPETQNLSSAGLLWLLSASVSLHSDQLLHYALHRGVGLVATVAVVVYFDVAAAVAVARVFCLALELLPVAIVASLTRPELSFSRLCCCSHGSLLSGSSPALVPILLLDCLLGP